MGLIIIYVYGVDMHIYPSCATADAAAAAAYFAATHLINLWHLNMLHIQ
jgi:hypothetical protein